MKHLTDFLPNADNGYRLDVDALEAWADQQGDTPDGAAAADFVEFLMTETGASSGILVTTNEHLTDHFRWQAEDADEIRGSVKDYADDNADFWDGYADSMSDDCTTLYYLSEDDDTTFDGDWIVLAPR